MLQDKNSSFSVTDIFANAAKAAAVAIVFTAVLLPIASAIAYSTTDPGSLTDIFGKAVLYLSAMAAGLAAARFSVSDPRISAATGFISGAMLLLFVLAMSLVPEDSVPSTLSPGTRIIMYLLLPVISSAVGAVTHRRTKRHRPARHRRR